MTSQPTVGEGRRRRRAENRPCKGRGKWGKHGLFISAPSQAISAKYNGASATISCHFTKSECRGQKEPRKRCHFVTGTRAAAAAMCGKKRRTGGRTRTRVKAITLSTRGRTATRPLGTSGKSNVKIDDLRVMNIEDLMRIYGTPYHG